MTAKFRCKKRSQYLHVLWNAPSVDHCPFKQVVHGSFVLPAPGVYRERTCSRWFIIHSLSVPICAGDCTHSRTGVNKRDRKKQGS